jgi:uncharacterized membrane protein
LSFLLFAVACCLFGVWCLFVVCCLLFSFLVCCLSVVIVCYFSFCL